MTPADKTTRWVIGWLRQHAQSEAPALFSMSREDAARIVTFLDGQALREWRPIYPEIQDRRSCCDSPPGLAHRWECPNRTLGTIHPADAYRRPSDWAPVETPPPSLDTGFHPRHTHGRGE